ncbi:hypothetical protein [Paenibacillus rhizolycopersici]|uniref:hypothetical protein n=1 Tax=Paenibacillus rhizolycopersici TaxID=2780073 RepID=UPI003D29DF30
MLGKASEIKIYQVEELNAVLESEIESVLESHPDWQVLDFKFAITKDGDKVYREALIIYKEAQKNE